MPCVYSAYRGQKSAPESQGLELQMVVNASEPWEPNTGPLQDLCEPVSHRSVSCITHFLKRYRLTSNKSNYIGFIIKCRQYYSLAYAISLHRNFHALFRLPATVFQGEFWNWFQCCLCCSTDDQTQVCLKAEQMLCRCLVTLFSLNLVNYSLLCLKKKLCLFCNKINYIEASV